MARQDLMVNMNTNATQKFLTRDELRKQCPLAFCTEPTRPVSDKYVVATTMTVVDDLEKLGWKPVKAMQRKNIKKSPDGSLVPSQYSLHAVVFQNPDTYITKMVDGKEEIESYPQIILWNSFDGSCSFRFMVGCYRLVCSNGLVICDNQFADVRIRHIHYTFDQMRQVVMEAMKNVDTQIKKMDAMEKVELTKEQQIKMAYEFLKIRGTRGDVDEKGIESILTPKRPEDEGNSLWTTFNILQEHMTQGGFKVTKGEKSRKARPVKSFIKDLEMNQEMWKYATSLIPEQPEPEQELAEAA